MRYAAAYRVADRHGPFVDLLQHLGQRLERAQVVAGQEIVDVAAARPACPRPAGGSPRRRPAGSSRRCDGRPGAGASSARTAAWDRPRSQPSEAITTIAPRVVPRRPQTSLKALRFSPMRVPPAQSGTARAALASARSGSRPAQVRREPREARAERERLDVPSGAHRRLQEHHHRARVGLHRARDVDQVDELARHAASARARRARSARRRCASPRAGCAADRRCGPSWRAAGAASGGAARARATRATSARARRSSSGP